MPPPTSDPFSPGLQPFTRILGQDLPGLRTRALNQLLALERDDSEWHAFYGQRRTAFQALALSAPNEVVKRRRTRARPAAQALRAGDITRLEKLATELMGAVRPGTAGLENADGDVQSGGRPAGQRAYRGPVVRLADRLNR
jgi:hypothetical protein